VRETRAIQEWFGDQSRPRAVYMAMTRIGSGISGGSESAEYFLTNGFASVRRGHGRSWWIFAKVQAIGKMMWMAGTAPRVNGIEIEIARRFVGLWKSSRDKLRQRFAERLERQPIRRAAVTGGMSPPGGSLKRIAMNASRTFRPLTLAESPR
jgi:hypothetical protein